MMTKIHGKVKEILKSFDIDHANGFLRSQPPLRCIPLDQYPKYGIWEEIMSELPQLLIAQSFAKRMENIPIISDISDLLSANLDVRRRALTVLSFFSSAFMNESQIVDYKSPKLKPKPRSYLPECIAIPLYQLCMAMHCPPIIRHCHLVLNNWRLLFPPFDFNHRHRVDNAALNNLFLGGIDENWFFLIGFGIESHFGPILSAILSIQELMNILRTNCRNRVDDPHSDCNLNDVIEDIKGHLIEIRDHLDAMSILLQRYYEKLDGHIFYRRVRIFLTGCESEQDFPFGVEFKGIPSSSGPLIGTTKVYNAKSEYLCLRYNGASAAQASGFPVIDHFLGVDQTKDDFLKLMMDYMPFEHRLFVRWMRKERINMVQCMKKMIECGVKDQDMQEIRQLANQCLAKLRKFRNTHMGITRDMIVTPAAKLQENTKGTGGSTLIPYLKSVRDRTKNGLLSKL